jgi:hypothetical protein
MVEDLRGDGLRGFLRSRGRKLIRCRALVISTSISVINRCASDPHAITLLIRSSGSCRMFGHPRGLEAAPTRNRTSQRPVLYTRESNLIRHAERTLAYFVPRLGTSMGGSRDPSGGTWVGQHPGGIVHDDANERRARSTDRAREIGGTCRLSRVGGSLLGEQLTDYGATTAWGSLP